MLKGALIGCGFFSRNHLHAWSQLEGVEIVALCDTDAARLSAMASEFRIGRTYTDAGELFASEKLDFVDIATTVKSHRPLVEMAAAARVPCICQKPFALTLDDARAMVEACEAGSIPLMVHENFRWQTPVQAVHRVLQSGAIGTPFWGRFSFRSAFDVYRAQPYLAKGSRFIIEDLGIHILDVARYLLGDARVIGASTQRVNQGIAGEDGATMLLSHQHGATSVVDCSYASPRAKELFPQTLIEIDGSAGSVQVSADYVLSVHRVDGESYSTSCEPPLHPWAERPWFNIQDSVLNIQQHWLDCLREGVEPQTSGRDNLKTLELVESSYAAAGEADNVR